MTLAFSRSFPCTDCANRCLYELQVASSDAVAGKKPACGGGYHASMSLWMCMAEEHLNDHVKRVMVLVATTGHAVVAALC